MYKWLAVIIMGLIVSACSSNFRTNAEREYMNSRNGQMLEVPPPLSAQSISHFYDLPPKPSNAKVDIKPPV